MASGFRYLSAQVRDPVPMHGQGTQLHPGYNNEMPVFDKHPFDPEHSTLPIWGVTGGTINSGMNYDYLPRGMPILLPTPKPPPNQGWDGGLLEIGTPVRIINFNNAATNQYNGCVGDVVGEEFQQHGAVVYAIRIWSWEMKEWLATRKRDTYDAYMNIPVSQWSQRHALHNRQQLYPGAPTQQRVECRHGDFDIHEIDPHKDTTPPYIVMRLPPRNLQKLGNPSKAAEHPVERMR